MLEQRRRNEFKVEEGGGEHMNTRAPGLYFHVTQLYSQQIRTANQILSSYKNDQSNIFVTLYFVHESITGTSYVEKSGVSSPGNFENQNSANAISSD